MRPTSRCRSSPSSRPWRRTRRASTTRPRRPDDGDDDGLDGFELTLAPPPPLAGGGDAGTPGLTRREEKRQLRDDNATVARELARRAGLTHAQVNAELNRLSGVGKVSEATVEQLERRLAAADSWLAKT